MEASETIQRPVIYNYRSIPDYLQSRVLWLRREIPGYSLKSRIADAPNCSPALVSQVIRGKRRLTRDRVKSFAHIFHLNSTEEQYLDTWVAGERSPPIVEVSDTTVARQNSEPKNHLLNDWLNLFVKDSLALRGFSPNSNAICKLLHGLSTEKRIERSFQFLLAQGFVRKALSGHFVVEENLTTTTTEISDVKIRKFHKKALDIAKAALDKYPVSKRKAYFLSFAVDADELNELNDLVREFYEKLQRFSEKKSLKKGKRSSLYQVIINLSPVGGNIE